MLSIVCQPLASVDVFFVGRITQTLIQFSIEESGMNTKTVGDISEAMVLAALVRVGKDVLIPWGDNLRYDMAYDDDGKLIRVQCKTAQDLGNGSFTFPTASSQAHRGKGRRNYRGQIEFFGVYCPSTQEVYLVPVDDVGLSSATLRVEPSVNNQTKKVRWAKDYVV
jgi:hypothetical protein